jgi:16S rRNA (uracil1498-N3)-methyltransferase
LVHALAKADKPERVLRDATALGVGCISWVESERSVSKLGARVHLKQRRLAEVALQAARQCLRSDVPVITLARSFEAALSDACGPGTIVLQPARGALLSTALSEFDAQKINLWIGPEGGFSEREQGELRSRGAIFANLGSLVLRTELAATVALAIATDHLRRR